MLTDARLQKRWDNKTAHSEVRWRKVVGNMSTCYHDYAKKWGRYWQWRGWSLQSRFWLCLGLQVNNDYYFILFELRHDVDAVDNDNRGNESVASVNVDICMHMCMHVRKQQYNYTYECVWISMCMDKTYGTHFVHCDGLRRFACCSGGIREERAKSPQSAHLAKARKQPEERTSV